MKITIPRNVLAPFRKQCREAYPKETIGVLHGVRTEAGDLIIAQIKSIPHTASEDGINYGGQVYRSKMKALRAGADWLGTIHSHPWTEQCQTCPHPSETDVKSGLEFGEAVMGIVYVFLDEPLKAGVKPKLRTSVHWYVPSPIPEVEMV